jgi:hypothetical protein
LDQAFIERQHNVADSDLAKRSRSFEAINDTGKHSGIGAGQTHIECPGDCGPIELGLNGTRVEAVVGSTVAKDQEIRGMGLDMDHLVQRPASREDGTETMQECVGMEKHLHAEQQQCRDQQTASDCSASFNTRTH